MSDDSEDGDDSDQYKSPQRDTGLLVFALEKVCVPPFQQGPTKQSDQLCSNR